MSFSSKLEIKPDFEIDMLQPYELICNVRLFSDIFDRTAACFDAGKGVVFLTGNAGLDKAAILKSFAHEKKDMFGKIIFLSVNAGRYYFPGSSLPVPETDVILKEQFIRKASLLTSHFCPPFKPRTEKELIAELAKYETLILIDGEEFNHFPAFLSMLVDYGFKIIYSAEKIEENIPRYCKKIKLGSPSSELASKALLHSISCCERYKASLCSLLGNFPLAIFLAEKHLLHNNISVAELSKRILSTAKEHDLVPKKDYVKLFYFFADFSPGEKEVFRTLGIFLRYARIPYGNQKATSELFSIKYAEQISDKPFEKWKRLLHLGFFSVTDSGVLYAKKEVLDFVIDFLAPTSSSCPCFMKYISDRLDCKISQKSKNLYAKIKKLDNDAPTDILFTEYLPDVYAYFSHTDEKCGSRIYTLIMTYCLTFLGTEKSEVFTEHLNLFGNTVLLECFLKKFDFDVYENSDDAELYNHVYTSSIKFYMDTLRICTCLIRFSSHEQFYQNKYIFSVMYNTIQKIIDEIEGNESDVLGKLLLCNDVLRLCEESFFCFCDISADGKYHINRCRQSSVMDYFDNPFTNYNLCSSVYPLGDAMSLRLYAKIHHLTLIFLNLSEKSDIPEEMTYYHTSQNRKKAFAVEFSSFFNRIMRGFDVFFDFYDDEYTVTDTNGVISEMTDEAISVLLKKAEEIMSGTFDENGKNAENYAKQIIKSVKESKNSFLLASLVLDADFPISEGCRIALTELNFAEALFFNSSNRAETARNAIIKCAYELTKSTAYFPFYENIIMIAEKITTLNPDEAVSDAAENICYSYIKEVCRHFGKRLDNWSFGIHRNDRNMLGFSCKFEELFRRFNVLCSESTSAERCVAEAAYRLKEGQPPAKASKKSLYEAVITLIYTRIRTDEDFSRLGFAFMIKPLFNKDELKQITEELTNEIYSPKLTSEEIKAINKYAES